MVYDGWRLGDQVMVYFYRPNSITHLVDPKPHSGDHGYLLRIASLNDETPSFQARDGQLWPFSTLTEDRAFGPANLSKSRRANLTFAQEIAASDSSLWAQRELASWACIVREDEKEAAAFLAGV